MSRLRAAVIGAGRWGTNLIRCVQRSSHFELVAVLDSDQNILAKYGSVGWESSQLTEAVNRTKPDAILIVTPPSTHFRFAARSLTLGLHVWCEKPLALSVPHCEELARLAGEMQRVLLVDCTPLFLEEVQQARTQIKASRVQRIVCTRTSCGPARHGIPVAWDLAPHDIAVLRFWLGSLPAIWKATAPDENFFAVWAEHQTGIELEVRVGYQAAAERHFVIEGDFRALTLHQQQRHPEPLAWGLEHFAHCIRTGCPPICGGPESIEITRVLQDTAPLTHHSLSRLPFRKFVNQC